MTFGRAVFGRKVAPGERTVPRELWDGPAGETLNAMGHGPDDPRNFALTQERADAKVEEEFAIQRAYLDHLNAQLPEGVSVCAYAMLPWELWNGRYGHLLAVVCKLYPQQPWNNLWLAADERSSAALGLPQHPGFYPDWLVPQVEGLLGELHDHFAQACGQVGEGGQVQWAQLEHYEQETTEILRKVIALSHYVGSMCIGEDAFARHKEIFGMQIGWPD